MEEKRVIQDDGTWDWHAVEGTRLRRARSAIQSREWRVGVIMLAIVQEPENYRRHGKHFPSWPWRLAALVDIRVAMDTRLCLAETFAANAQLLPCPWNGSKDAGYEPPGNFVASHQLATHSAELVQDGYSYDRRCETEACSEQKASQPIHELEQLCCSVQLYGGVRRSLLPAAFS